MQKKLLENTKSVKKQYLEIEIDELKLESYSEESLHVSIIQKDVFSQIKSLHNKYVDDEECFELINKHIISQLSPIYHNINLYFKDRNTDCLFKTIKQISMINSKLDKLDKFDKLGIDTKAINEKCFKIVKTILCESCDKLDKKNSNLDVNK
jgi:hypothetical protein